MDVIWIMTIQYSLLCKIDTKLIKNNKNNYLISTVKTIYNLFYTHDTYYDVTLILISFSR